MRSCRRPFTLMELLVTIAIIAVLAGLLLPGLSAAREHARRTRAKTEMKFLQSAIAMYESDYGVLPQTGAADRVLTAAEFTGLIGVLQNYPDGANARKKRYLDVSADTGPGVFNDPWEQQYKVALDLNYDGQVDVTADGPFQVVYGRSAMWALGKDHFDQQGNEGDINSWKE